MLLEVALPFAVACGTLGLAWLHSIFRWQNRASRGAWVVLTAACFATAVVNVRMAFRYLSADCAAAVPSTETFVYALLLMYVPVIAVPGTLVLAILAATAVQLRRRRLHSPLKHAALFGLLHRTVLKCFEVAARRGFILYHIAVVSVHWVAEPFIVLGTWHLVPPACRDYRVFACCCAGLEVALCIVRLVIRTSVLKELKYERALLRVDALNVRYMEVTKCTRCGMQFFGSPDEGLGLAGEGRAEFVRHFFSVHGDTVSESDFTVEMRAAISRTDKDGASPNILRWHEQNDKEEKAQREPGKNMPAGSRGQEIVVHRATGGEGSTPFQSTVHRNKAGGLGAAQRSANAQLARPSVVERWADEAP